MNQKPITAFYGKRKRIADDVILANKKLRDDGVKLGLGVTVTNKVKQDKVENVLEAKTTKINKGGKIQLDIRESLKASEKNNETSVEKDILSADVSKISDAVPMQNCSNASPSILDVESSKRDELLKTPIKKVPEPSVQSSDSIDDIIKSANQLVNRIKATQQKPLRHEITPKKELSLKDIKATLKKSSRLNELKSKLKEINDQAEKFMKKENEKKLSLSPQIKKFTSFEVEVNSPTKGSPSKFNNSPIKLPAYQRFESLAQPSTALTLPCSYQKLQDLFEAMDKLTSMIMNRGEVVTFRKLQASVQEMTRKTMTERHLGQIMAITPHFYTLKQELLKNFGSTSKVDRYELVVRPIVSGKDDKLTPNQIKQRREEFYNRLLTKTKEHHEEFLKSLDPPVTISQHALKRWHPDFMTYNVPDVVPVELPKSPSSEKPASAKDVLERARHFLSNSNRLMNALEAASQTSEPAPAVAPPPAEIKKAVDARLKDPLKGVPSALLQKIRAKQAAKALEVMRMSPEEEKETLMYTRLPDFARIVRTLFVDERKSVLPWDLLLDKIQFSYNRNINRGEVESHVHLLIKLLPEWLGLIKVRNASYLKMQREAPLTQVIEKLNKVVDEKKKTLLR